MIPRGGRVCGSGRGLVVRRGDVRPVVMNERESCTTPPGCWGVVVHGI